MNLELVLIILFHFYLSLFGLFMYIAISYNNIFAKYRDKVPLCINLIKSIYHIDDSSIRLLFLSGGEYVKSKFYFLIKKDNVLKYIYIEAHSVKFISEHDYPSKAPVKATSLFHTYSKIFDYKIARYFIYIFFIGYAIFSIYVTFDVYLKLL